MRKSLFSGGVNVARHATINLYYIGMRDPVEAHMTVRAVKLTVNRDSVFLTVDIKYPFVAFVIISADCGIGMTEKTVFPVTERTLACG